MSGTTVTAGETGAIESDVRYTRLSLNRLIDDLEAVRAATAGTVLVGSATYDPGSLADGAGATTTVTVTGAVLGDYAQVSFSLDLQGITLTGYVSATNTVSARFQNESGGTLDLASGTLRAVVRSFATTAAVAAATLTAYKVADLDAGTT